jgi:hypothetical protein
VASPAEPQPVSPRAERTYRAIACYAFDEPVCHPSQETIARDLGCARETVNRDVRELREAGWLRIKERRRGWHDGEPGWWFNVYELLADYVVGITTVKRIVRRAHNTRKKRQQRLGYRAGHMNTSCGVGRSGRGWCGCRFCRPDKPKRRKPPPPLGRLPEFGYLVLREKRVRDEWVAEKRGPGAALEWLERQPVRYAGL